MSIARAFATVEDGNLVIYGDRNTVLVTIKGDATAHEIAAALKSARIESVICSSSVDFPEEYGAPSYLGHNLSNAFLLLDDR